MKMVKLALPGLLSLGACSTLQTSNDFFSPSPPMICGEVAKSGHCEHGVEALHTLVEEFILTTQGAAPLHGSETLEFMSTLRNKHNQLLPDPKKVIAKHDRKILLPTDIGSFTRTYKIPKGSLLADQIYALKFTQQDAQGNIVTSYHYLQVFQPQEQ